MILNLLPGITETNQYIASIFPGGEVQFKLKSFSFPYFDQDVYIKARIQNSDLFMLLALAVDTIKKSNGNGKILVDLNYIPYQQSDEDFGKEECWGLKTFSRFLNALPVDRYNIFDPHSKVVPAFIPNCNVFDQSKFAMWVLRQLRAYKLNEEWTIKHNLTVLSPDAGAYKKLFKLMNTIEFDEGVIESANKFRSSKGELKLHVSTEDFQGRDVLIFDDICLGGRTFVELAEALQNRNIGNLYLAVSHGIFNQGLDSLAKYYHKAFTTNSWQSRDELMKKVDSSTIGISPDFLEIYMVVDES